MSDEKNNTFEVKCIKCGQLYQEIEQEAYFCPSCLIEQKKIAAELDAKIKPQTESISGLQQFDALPKIGGFVNSKYL